MSARTTRSRTAKNGEESQTLVKDYFKTTRKPAKARGEKKLLDETPTVVKKEEVKTKTRHRTPTREAVPPDVSGSPPKRAREEVVLPAPTLSTQNAEVVLPAPVLSKKKEEVILDSGSSSASALDSLMNAAAAQKKKKTIRTVADLQARLAEKGAARSIHEQNLKNKSKQVEQHAELLKSPVKKIITDGPVPKSKAARCIKDKIVPDYVLPSSNLLKSAEKIREEEVDNLEAEANKRSADFLKTSKLFDYVKDSVKSDVELPRSYEYLANAFQHVDKVVSIINGQHRSCVAAELFKNVKNTLHKDFSTLHLSQILHLYPQSYRVEMREQWKPFGGVQAGKYELEVRPNLVDDLTGFVKEDASSLTEFEEVPLVRPGKLMASPVKSPKKNMAQPALRKAEIDGRIRLDAARMRDRSHIFRYKLIELVKSHHTKFLESQGIKVAVNRMHPHFRPDKHCPPVELKALPEAPIVKNNTHVGMREYMEANLEPKHIELPSIVQKAIDDLKSPVKSMTGASGSVPLSPKKFAEMQAEQKSKGGMSLLERIRAREACRKVAESLVDKNLEIRRNKLTLLNERYLSTLCNIYTTKKAQSMELDTVADKLVYSSPVATSRSDVITHLELLCSIASSYMSETTMMGRKYLRITDNNYDAISEIVREQLSSVTDSIAQQTKQIENAQKVATNPSQQHAPRPFSPKASKAARSLKFA